MIAAEADVAPVVCEGIQAAEPIFQRGQVICQILGERTANDHIAVQHGVDITDGESQIVQIRLPSVLIGEIAGGKPGKKILQRDVQVIGQAGGGTICFQTAPPAAVSSRARATCA